jgi:RNA polymerase sigma-70 factor, ECF subfamily
LSRLDATEPDARTRWRREEREAVVDAHYRGVYRLLLWLTNDPDAAADLTQETFAAFWESTARQAPAAVPDLKAWLYGIARNRWRKRCRDARAARAESIEAEAARELPDQAPGPEVLALAEAEAETVTTAFAALPADYREALALRVFEELGYAEIAALLGISEGLARWRAHRGRLLLRAALRQDREREETGASA